MSPAYCTDADTEGAYRVDLWLERVLRRTGFGLYYRQVVIRGTKKPSIG